MSKSTLFHGGVRVKQGPKADNKSIILRLPQDLHAFVRTHAFRRDISEQELIRLILTCWVRRATPIGNTDPKKNDPIYSVYSIGYHLPTAPNDEGYYPGLVASLRFLPEVEVDIPDGNEPPPRTKSELWPGVAE